VTPIPTLLREEEWSKVRSVPATVFWVFVKGKTHSFAGAPKRLKESSILNGQSSMLNKKQGDASFYQETSPFYNLINLLTFLLIN